MLGVVPSQVVQEIDRRFPGYADPQFGLKAEHSAKVSALLGLLSRLPERHLLLLSPSERLLFASTKDLIRSTLEHWKHVGSRERRLTGGPSMERVEGRHPVEVLRSLLSQCPDEAPEESVQALAFLGDPELQADMRQDIGTAQGTLSNHQFKPACVMAGSVIEALLLWAVNRKAADIGLAIAECKKHGEGAPSKATPEEWDLSHLLNVARRLPVISEETFKAADSAREYRNLIHPGRAQRLKIRATMARATLAVGAMQQVADDLAARVAAGSL